MNLKLGQQPALIVLGRDAEITNANRNHASHRQKRNRRCSDTGIDANHPDLAGRVTRNIKLADTLERGSWV